MEKITYNDLLEAGVHFGHLRKKWNPKMLPYIFMEKKGIHLIDLNRTLEKLDEAANALRGIARSGKKVMFVATKKQAKEIMEEQARRVGMPFVTERWLGGMLTNFTTIRKSIKKLQTIDKMLGDAGTNITKKERLVLGRERDKLEKVIGGVAQLNRLPAALLIVDIGYEHIALAEAHKLNINTIGMVDTNCDPNKVDYAIPANDDAAKSIELIIKYLTDAIAEGLEERAKSKEEADEAARNEDDDDDMEVVVNIDEDEDGEKRKSRTSKGVADKKGPARRPAGRRPSR
ncbi:MAG: 30S ribosomal protein S2 [Chitinophagales bacterium]|nr:30S ribosomal protein S2 [Chitinophagales bacterium]HAE13426.1 30S ribosomal protein S2 [Bacteroidota bacterium]MCB9020113.1 30S ribosomal protein S2 [Chitinophagales bacterium]MCB9021518.1 30S ribosomal protein S2 [Chitinophagales bacterium]MCB9032045.1 30S ribosomal protein S2 [Chitinophagales bacterium]